MMNHEAGKVCLNYAADVLESLGTPFFLIQGTALGAYRDRGFVPTERDVDFGVLIEHMIPAAPDIAKLLVQAGCEIESWGRPFRKIRTLTAKIGEAKIDIVGFHKWSGKRFATSPVSQFVPVPYSIVHDAELLENYQQIELFGRTFNIPSPIETYLEREYGPDWRTPKDDHISRTRIYNFTRDNRITDDNATPEH